MKLSDNNIAKLCNRKVRKGRWGELKSQEYDNILIIPIAKLIIHYQCTSKIFTEHLSCPKYPNKHQEYEEETVLS